MVGAAAFINHPIRAKAIHQRVKGRNAVMRVQHGRPAAHNLRLFGVGANDGHFADVF